MKRRARHVMVALLAASIAGVLAGCGRGGTLFEDSFDDMESGWEIDQYVEGAVGYRDGAYIVISYGDSNMMWGRLTGHSFEDVDVRVQASQVVAPANNNNSFGIGCRLQPNNDGYYLRISSDGYYAITRVVEGIPTQLVDWTPAAVINQGSTVNTLRAVCDGEALTLYANGQQLVTATDDAFQSGDIALTATSFELEPTEIRFDNLTVERPERDE